MLIVLTFFKMYLNDILILELTLFFVMLCCGRSTALLLTWTHPVFYLMNIWSSPVTRSIYDLKYIIYCLNQLNIIFYIMNAFLLLTVWWSWSRLGYRCKQWLSTLLKMGHPPPKRRVLKNRVFRQLQTTNPRKSRQIHRDQDFRQKKIKITNKI